MSGRTLHYVMKVGDRGGTVRFFKDILGMKVLRHEEFAEGCPATCNGPYENRWSKTMVGYGPEDDHFAIELTYNYPIKSYKKGNDFISMTIKSKEALERAKTLNWPIKEGHLLEAPGGFVFDIINEPQPTNSDPIQKVTLASSDLARSIEYWNGLLGLQIFNRDDKNGTVLLGFNKNQVQVELKDIKGPVVRNAAYGRVAFSIPFDQQPALENKLKAANMTILTPLTTLDTPGKASVRVLIITDPDGQEICFVDDETYRQLSQYAPEEEKILDRFIKKDESGALEKTYGSKS